MECPRAGLALHHHSYDVTMCDADYATASKARGGQPGSVCGFPVEIMRALLQYVEIMPTLCDHSLNAVHAQYALPVPCKLMCWSTLQLFIPCLGRKYGIACHGTSMLWHCTP